MNCYLSYENRKGLHLLSRGRRALSGRTGRQHRCLSSLYVQRDSGAPDFSRQTDTERLCLRARCHLEIQTASGPVLSDLHGNTKSILKITDVGRGETPDDSYLDVEMPIW